MDPARHLRQILLAEIGTAGQERIAAARAQVAGPTEAHAVAETYARRAGFAGVTQGPLALPLGEDGDLVRTPAARELVAGARLALAEMRRVAFTERGQ